MSNPQVMCKNITIKNEEVKTFELALQVFADLRQTPISGDLHAVSQSTYSDSASNRIEQFEFDSIQLYSNRIWTGVNSIRFEWVT